MPTPDSARRQLDLSPQERRAVEGEIRDLQRRATVFVGLGPGYCSDTPFFPCGPLELEEYNLDYRGNLTLCCQLSGYAGGTPGTDLVGNLHDLSLMEAVERFHQRVASYLADKRAKICRAEVSPRGLKPAGFDMQLLDWARAELLQEPDAWPIFPELLTLWQGRLFKDRAAVVANILSRDVVAKAYAIHPASKKLYFYSC